MINMLELKDGDKILEPCAGDGAFIEEILHRDKNIEIEACDLNENSVKLLQDKFGDRLSHVWHTDTLFCDYLDKSAVSGGYYDKVIGNPPWGAFQDYDKRDGLKKKYNGYYVKETYSLFLIRCISVLLEGGTLSFITPDTFLFLNMHKKLRELILTQCKIKEITIFPSKFFPDVHFGYSNICIMTIEKCSNKNESLKNRFKVIKDLKKENDIENVSNNNLKHLTVINLVQEEVYRNDGHNFLLNDDNDIVDMISSSDATTLKDIADIRTGIYTGDNKRFFKVANAVVKKNYPVITEAEKNTTHKSLQFINGENTFIPIAKGSPSQMYVEPVKWYIDWSPSAMDFYMNNKKARFQNNEFYFKRGVGIPMVKSRKIKASLINEMVFDQSIVGIFPHEEKYLYFLLAFLNSDIANNIIHTINPTANSSANYIKKVPVILPEAEELESINEKVKQIINYLNEDKKPQADAIHLELNNYFNELFNNCSS